MNVTMYNISIILIKVNRLYYMKQHIRRIEQFRLRRFDRADDVCHDQIPQIR